MKIIGERAVKYICGRASSGSGLDTVIFYSSAHGQGIAQQAKQAASRRYIERRTLCGHSCASNVAGTCPKASKARSEVGAGWQQFRFGFVN